MVSVFSLCRAQLVSTTLALRTTSYLSVETEYIPWQSALNNFQYYYLMLDQTEVYQPMQVLDMFVSKMYVNLSCLRPLVVIERQSSVSIPTNVFDSPDCNTCRSTWRSWWRPSFCISRTWHPTGPRYLTDTLISEYLRLAIQSNTHTDSTQYYDTQRNALLCCMKCCTIYATPYFTTVCTILFRAKVYYTNYISLWIIEFSVDNRTHQHVLMFVSPAGITRRMPLARHAVRE